MDFVSKKNFLITLSILLLQSVNIYAQKDTKAGNVLEQVSAAYDKTNGIDITFGGSVDGVISLKGNMFWLNCDGVETWFDGVTQWSYIKESNEVNISSPSPEEQNNINPYALIRMYKNGFSYKYMGEKTFKGEVCSEITLVPEVTQNYERINVLINPRLEPVNIEFVYSEEDKDIITVKKYKPNPNLTEDDFRFDMDAHPNVEIIDLR